MSWGSPWVLLFQSPGCPASQTHKKYVFGLRPFLGLSGQLPYLCQE